MAIPFSFSFKSPALHKCVCLVSFKVIQILNSAISGEMLQVAFSFQNSVNVTCWTFQVFTTIVDINYDFILSKNLNNLNLYTNWSNMWYPNYQNKKLNLYMLSSFKGFICASNKPLRTLIINLRKNSICACHCNHIKTSFARIKKEYKICISNLSMNNAIYLLREQR